MSVTATASPEMATLSHFHMAMGVGVTNILSKYKTVIEYKPLPTFIHIYICCMYVSVIFLCRINANNRYMFMYIYAHSEMRQPETVERVKKRHRKDPRVSK